MTISEALHCMRTSVSLLKAKQIHDGNQLQYLRLRHIVNIAEYLLNEMPNNGSKTSSPTQPQYNEVVIHGS